MARFHAPTPGTRIAVWLFPPVTVWLGLTYLLSPPSRLQSPAFEAAKAVFPMRVWGGIFLAVAVLKLSSLLLVHHAPGFVIAMCAGMGLYACWAVLIGAAAFVDPHASYGGAAVLFGWSAMHAAVLATITDGRPKGLGRRR